MKTAILVVLATISFETFAQYYPPNPSMPVMCTSRQVGSMIVTNCF